MMFPAAASTTETPVNQLHKLTEAVSLARQTLEIQVLSDKFHPEALDNLAEALWNRFKQGGKTSDLDEAILLLRQVLERRPASDPLRLISLNNLSKVLQTRFQHGGQQSDLREAIVLSRQALEPQNFPNPDLSMSYINLANALFRQFEQGGHQLDLDEAIFLNRQSLNLRISPHPERSTSLNNLAACLRARFQRGSDINDLEEAISLHRQALDLRVSPHPLRSSSLDNLATSLQSRFEQGGDRVDLDEAILLHQEALELRPPPHPYRSLSLNNLANALWQRFNQNGHQIDLEDAISLHRQALNEHGSSSYSRSLSLNNLANALHIRFKQSGHRIDLEDAILLNKQALELQSSPRSQSFDNLGIVLFLRFTQEGDQNDLEQAISMYRKALALRVPPDSDRPASLNNLATALWTRFGQGGRRIDLDEAISMYREALQGHISTHSFRSQSVNNLANALRTRFEQGRQRIDLDEAILLGRQALALRNSPHPLQSSSLNNLANVLLVRFEEGRDRNNLNEAISLHRQALELRPFPHPERSLSLSSLGGALQLLFNLEGHEIDLDEAISLHKQALELQLTSHPERSSSLNNLGEALQLRFVSKGYKTDLDEAISLHRQASKLIPSIHPKQSQSLYGLAKGLIHVHSHAGDSEYLEEAMELFRAATQCLSQPASLRLRIANTWVKLGGIHQHCSIVDAYEAALQALPKLAALSFDVKSRQEALLADSDGLARDASRFAIQAGRIDKAIQFLEEGRAIFWSQFLSLRSPFERLHSIAPELAVKLRDTASALELGSHRNSLADISDNQGRLVVDQESARLNRLNEEWSKTVDDVRKLDGFDDFLHTRKLSGLRVAASGGPVVMLVGNDNGSDILILTSANVHNIRLSGLSTSQLQSLVYLIQAASSNSQLSRSHIESNTRNSTPFPLAMVETLRSWIKLQEERGMRCDTDHLNSDDIFRYVLDKLWNEVVKPVINILQLKKSEEPAVVRWCPTGLFTFLPIHAAGHYDGNLPIDCASDYFISTYTPTIRALLTEDQTPSSGQFKMMVVIQSHGLPSTQKELEKIQQHVSNNFLVTLGIPGASASVETVASKLSNVSIAHFSCHGKQDQLNPLNSGLKLEDGWLHVSRIMQEKIPNGALAFLSACETAMGVEKLPDEAMSLGASLLFSGFHRVIATMWEMMDKDGPVIADTFYEELFRGSDGKPTREPDVRKSARALHMAVKGLRSRNASFRRWVPFIHMGK